MFVENERRRRLIVSIQLKLENLINISIILLIIFLIETLYTLNGKFIIIMKNNLFYTIYQKLLWMESNFYFAFIFCPLLYRTRGVDFTISIVFRTYRSNPWFISPKRFVPNNLTLLNSHWSVSGRPLIFFENTHL